MTRLASVWRRNDVDRPRLSANARLNAVIVFGESDKPRESDTERKAVSNAVTTSDEANASKINRRSTVANPKVSVPAVDSWTRIVPNARAKYVLEAAKISDALVVNVLI